MAEREQDRERLQAAAERWERETAARSLEKAPERKAAFATPSGLALKRCYTPLDLEGWEYGERLGFPGEYPFTRGVQPTMYRGRLWTMRQYAGFATAAETNRRFRYLLTQGQTGLSVAFDLPTQIGYDSDDPRAAGEVGKVGVAIDSVEDMAALFEGIPLDRVSTSMTINATAAILLAMYVAVGERQNVPAKALAGTLQNDILKEYVARGTYIFPTGPSMRLVTDTIAFCAAEMPRFNPISISGYHIREAGATAAQEVAFTLGDGIAYVEAALRAGLAVDAFASQLSFFFNAHNAFFEEIAKFRAARRLWARIMRERFRATDPRSWMLRFHTQTSGVSLTAQQPENNAVRVAVQALAAVLGGTQSLHTNARDEALGLPTEAAALLALRTQQVLAHESGVADVVDPLGGAYFVEALTDALEAEAAAILGKIAAMGGMLRAIEVGYVQQEIQEAAYRHQRAVETGEQVVVGLNAYAADEPVRIPVFRVDPAVEEEARRRLAALRARRDGAAASRALEHLERAARGSENLLPRLLECVRSHATVGEICQRLRAVFGEYEETVTI